VLGGTASDPGESRPEPAAVAAHCGARPDSGVSRRHPARDLSPGRPADGRSPLLDLQPDHFGEWSVRWPWIRSTVRPDRPPDPGPSDGAAPAGSDRRGSGETITVELPGPVGTVRTVAGGLGPGARFLVELR